MRPDPIDISGVQFCRLHDYFGLWAVEEGRFRATYDQVARMNLALHVQQSDRRTRGVVVRQMKRPGQQIVTPGGQTRSVAAIEMTGLLMKSESSLYDSTSTVRLRREVRRAAQDDSVGGILLIVDSPGGTAAGTDDLAREVRDAAARKPVYAFIEDLGASAAYYVASQATRVFANSASAEVGSIGTLMGLYDLSGAAQQQGIRALVFATGPLKGTGFPGREISEAQQAYLQGRVDETQKSFDAAVRGGRGMSDEDLAAVRSGAIFLADEARRLKLIDGIQTLDATIAALFEEIANQGKGTRMTDQIAPATGLAVMEEQQDQPGAQSPDAIEAARQPAAAAPMPAEEPANEDPVAAPSANPRDELRRFMKAFGADGAGWYADGLSFEQASEKYTAKLQAENEDLRRRLAAVDRGEAEPAKFQSAEPDRQGKAKTRQAAMSDGLAALTAQNEEALAPRK